MDDAMPFPGDDEHEEQPKLPPEVQKLMEMIGGTAIPIGKNGAIAMLSEMKFERVIAESLSGISNTEFLLKHKCMPDGEAEQKAYGDGHLARTVIHVAISEYFAKVLEDAGHEQEQFVNKASQILALAYVGGVLIQDGSDVVRDAFKAIVGDGDSSVRDKLGVRMNEIAREMTAGFAKPEDVNAPAQPHIAMTREKLEDLKLKYAQAMKDHTLVFKFDGRDVDTSYAKYAIEYCEAEFAKKEKP